MYRLNHIIQQLAPNGSINQPITPIQTNQLTGNYCDIELARCCGKLSEWIYNINDDEKRKILPVHPRCHKYSDKGWINIHTNRLNMDSNNMTSFSILSPKVIPDTLFIIFAGTQLSDQPLQAATDLCASYQPLFDSSNNIISYVHSGIYGLMKNLYFDVHSNYLSASYLAEKGIDINQIKHIIITGTKYIHNNQKIHP